MKKNGLFKTISLEGEDKNNGTLLKCILTVDSWNSECCLTFANFKAEIFEFSKALVRFNQVKVEVEREEGFDFTFAKAVKLQNDIKQRLEHLKENESFSLIRKIIDECAENIEKG